MATGTHAGSTWNTTAGNKTVIDATPSVGDLYVVVHGMSGWASGDVSTITDSNIDGLGAYTRFGTATAPLSTGGGTACALWFSVRNALVGSGTSTTITATNSGDTGGGLTVLRFSGMSRVGVQAVLQSIGESTQTENPPQITFGAATLTANPIVLAVMGEDNPPALTSPSGFTEAVDTGWATPTTGVQVCWDDSGNTASNYAWSGGALTDHNEIAIELDTSAVPLDLFGYRQDIAGPTQDNYRKRTLQQIVFPNLLLATLFVAPPTTDVPRAPLKFQPHRQAFYPDRSTVGTRLPLDSLVVAAPFVPQGYVYTLPRRHAPALDFPNLPLSTLDFQKIASSVPESLPPQRPNRLGLDTSTSSAALYIPAAAAPPFLSVDFPTAKGRLPQPFLEQPASFLVQLAVAPFRPILEVYQTGRPPAAANFALGSDPKTLQARAEPFLPLLETYQTAQRRLPEADFNLGSDSKTLQARANPFAFAIEPYQTGRPPAAANLHLGSDAKTLQARAEPFTPPPEFHQVHRPPQVFDTSAGTDPRTIPVVSNPFLAWPEQYQTARPRILFDSSRGSNPATLPARAEPFLPPTFDVAAPRCVIPVEPFGSSSLLLSARPAPAPLVLAPAVRRAQNLDSSQSSAALTLQARAEPFFPPANILSPGRRESGSSIDGGPSLLVTLLSSPATAPFVPAPFDTVAHRRPATQDWTPGSAQPFLPQVFPPFFPAPFEAQFRKPPARNWTPGSAIPFLPEVFPPFFPSPDLNVPRFRPFDTGWVFQRTTNYLVPAENPFTPTPGFAPVEWRLSYRAQPPETFVVQYVLPTALSSRVAFARYILVEAVDRSLVIPRRLHGILVQADGREELT